VRASEDGRDFLARLLPYRTAEDKIIGAVLNFVDVTALHAAEEKVRTRSEERLRLAAEATRDFAIIATGRARLHHRLERRRRAHVPVAGGRGSPGPGHRR
jgi:hypothetical protein